VSPSARRIFWRRDRYRGFAEQNLYIFLAAEDGADGSGDFSGRERAGGDLVEEGLEKVKVALVEEGDVHVGALEGLRGDQAREASAQNQDAMGRWHEGEFSFDCAET
jgi:hypothetical protein